MLQLNKLNVDIRATNFAFLGCMTHNNQMLNFFLIVLSSCNSWMGLLVKYKCDLWLMQPANTLKTKRKTSFWLQTLLSSWMTRLSVFLAADAIRCLQGRQILLDAYTHKDVCWVVRCAPHVLSESLFSRGCLVSLSIFSSAGESIVDLQVTFYF